MTLKQHIGVVAGFALAANAFMIPSTTSMPEVAGDGVEALKGLDPITAMHAEKANGQLVKLQCPKCQLPGGFDAEMSLILNWTTTEDNMMVTLNGAPFLSKKDGPPADSYKFLQIPTGLPDFLTRFLSAQGQVTYQGGPDSESHVLDPLELNVRSSVRSIAATDDVDAQLIDIDFHIDDANAGKPSEIDGVTLRIMQNEDGTYQILEIVRVPADGSAPDEDKPSNDEDQNEQMFEILPIKPVRPSSPNGEPDMPEVPTLRHKPEVVDCHGLPLSVCRIQHMIKTKIASMHNAISAAMDGRPVGHHRPCMKGKNGPPGPHLRGGVNKYINPDGTPKVHPGHGPHGHHRHHHGPMHHAFHMLRRFMFGFVMPVMIGVAAGMTASLAGMLVGTGVAMLWFKIRRGGKRGSEGGVRLEQGEEHESEALMKEQEAAAEPRESEDTLPPYEEKQGQ